MPLAIDGCLSKWGNCLLTRDVPISEISRDIRAPVTFEIARRYFALSRELLRQGQSPPGHLPP